MPQFVPVRRSQHGSRSWSHPLGYSFAAKEIVAPILGLELPQAVLNLPLAFVRDHKAFQLVAVLALREHQNLFVDEDGSWLAGTHLPACFRSYPFSFARLAEDNAQALLCVDEESPLVRSDDQGEAFFAGDGELASSVGDILKFLELSERSRLSTNRAVESLARAEVIVPWEITVLGHSEQEGAIQGLFRIDQSKLNALPAETFEALRQVGALPVAYCQLLSAQHLPRLAELASQRGGFSIDNAPEAGMLPNSDQQDYDQIIDFQGWN